MDILQKHLKKDHVHMRLWTRLYGMNGLRMIAILYCQKVYIGYNIVKIKCVLRSQAGKAALKTKFHFLSSLLSGYSGTSL